jgi:hypothetical protein
MHALRAPRKLSGGRNYFFHRAGRNDFFQARRGFRSKPPGARGRFG